MSEWISVEDRLPLIGVRVLAYDSERDEFYAAKRNGFIWGWSIPGIGALNVTHWMPLPEPPKAKGE